MKKIILVLALMSSVTAFAEVSTHNQRASAQGNTASAQQTAVSGSNAANQGNAQSITFTAPADTHQTIDGTQTIKNVPSVSGPNLTTSNDTCMGSTSGSVNIAGLGIGGGSTWTDNNCKRLKNSRELWNMGMKAAALALLCNDAENKEALEITGYVCPTKKKDVKKTAETKDAAPTTTSKNDYITSMLAN